MTDLHLLFQYGLKFWSIQILHLYVMESGFESFLRSILSTQMTSKQA